MLSLAPSLRGGWRGRRAGSPASSFLSSLCVCVFGAADCLSCVNVGNKIAVIENLGATLVGK